MNVIYEKFLQGIRQNTPSTDKQDLSITEIYHAVRKIPYGSSGNRNPLQVLKSNTGSCSGKHILLRDLLRRTGREAEIITMYTHFNTFTPLVESYPEELKAICMNYEVPDFHHYTIVNENGARIKLDATWHDDLKKYGFVVNNDWQGEGDTILAAEPIKEYSPVEDVGRFKEELLSSLTAEQQKIRRLYFSLLTRWIAENSVSGL